MFLWSKYIQSAYIPTFLILIEDDKTRIFILIYYVINYIIFVCICIHTSDTQCWQSIIRNDKMYYSVHTHIVEIQ